MAVTTNILPPSPALTNTSVTEVQGTAPAYAMVAGGTSRARWSTGLPNHIPSQHGDVKVVVKWSLSAAGSGRVVCEVAYAYVSDTTTIPTHTGMTIVTTEIDCTTASAHEVRSSTVAVLPFTTVDPDALLVLSVSRLGDEENDTEPAVWHVERVDLVFAEFVP